MKPIYTVQLPPFGSTDDEKILITNYDEANLYYGDFACDEIKCYSENQIKEYAVNFASFLLRKISLTELSDLTFDKDHEAYAKRMLEEYQNTKNEEMK